MKTKMKNSTILLLSGAGLVLVITIAAVFGLRSIVGEAVALESLEGVAVARGPEASREYPIEGVEQLRFEGTWKAEVGRGDVPKLIIHAPEELLDQVLVHRTGNTAELSYDGRIRFGGKTVRAEIILPALSGIHSAGALDLEFSGFSGEELEIESSGAANIRGVAAGDDGGSEGNGSAGFGLVRIDSSGALNADLRSVPAENADLSISGTARVVLTMSGGSLTGEISGAGKVTYFGDVSEQRIETSGLASVERK